MAKNLLPDKIGATTCMVHQSMSDKKKAKTKNVGVAETKILRWMCGKIERMESEMSIWESMEWQ